jgi:hypothetical protein
VVPVGVRVSATLCREHQVSFPVSKVHHWIHVWLVAVPALGDRAQ